MYIPFRPVALFEPTAYASGIGLWYVLVLLLLLWVGFASSEEQVLNAEVLCCLYSLGWFPASNSLANIVAGKRVCLHHGGE